jgi:hypothetical protein
MTELATTPRSAHGRYLIAAFVLAVASIGVWILAGTVDDGLYLIAGVLGAAAAAAGWKAYRDAGRRGERRSVAWRRWSLVERRQRSCSSRWSSGASHSSCNR